ncbi:MULTISPECIES: FecR family protein [Butyricimonas]|uniref:FecR family protein n=1 Tax=Butyricimonas TaxID=574697 RepID=UPI000A75B402|nr:MULTISPECIES: FecR domain-containing protein [Butyricimonas]
MRMMKNKLAERNRSKIVRSLLEYFTGEGDLSQREILENWLGEDEKNRVLFEQLNDESYVQEGVEEFRRYDSREGWQKVEGRIRVRRRRLLVRWSYAASVIILFGVGIIAWNVFSERGEKTSVVHTVLQEDIAPGSSRAILVLESGETIFLGRERDSLTRGVTGESFVNDGERLIYSGVEEKKAKIHTLQIPRGGEYTLCLSDGTKITLNANSKIQYPDRFTGRERWVELEGEAYFEVAKDSGHPFVVRSRGAEVRVLGTSFNVKSYRGEAQQTTLVEGAVEVANEQRKVRLMPGEQAVWEGNDFRVREVNTASYTAWTKQRLVFDNEPLEGVLKILQRWYDVEICIENPSLKEVRFTADLPRYEHIKKILDLLEMTTDVKFELNENVLSVKKE